MKELIASPGEIHATGRALACESRHMSYEARKSHVAELYDCAHDFPERVSIPRLNYMLATLPRSGSTHLAIELWRTGMMGAPLEYPNPPFGNIVRRRLGLGDEDHASFWKAVQCIRTSPNGVFGFKMFMSDYLNWSRQHPEMLPHIAPGKVIFLTRTDLVEQAVSYSKAIRSGAWFRGVCQHSRPEYDAEHIERCIYTLQYQLDFWRDLFELTGTSVHHVCYEQLAADPACVIGGVAAFLGVDLDPKCAIDLPRMQIQRDEESAEWVRRYQDEHAWSRSCLPEDVSL